jgi:pyridoxal phosphate enzyme (YggS family)
MKKRTIDGPKIVSMMSNRSEILRHNLDAIERRLALACERAGRRRSEVVLVAITKYVDAPTAQLLLDLGVQLLGESRPQELVKKAQTLPSATWHLVGHLQRNKIDLVLPFAQLIHSVDSVRLLEALEAAAEKPQRDLHVLLEFNMSGESAKHGFTLSQREEVVSVLSRLKRVRVRGLMTMAAAADDSEHARPTFRGLRELRDWLAVRLAPPHDLRELSMGMTGDFEVAVEEGATLVRIGSAIFQGLN